MGKPRFHSVELGEDHNLLRQAMDKNVMAYVSERGGKIFLIVRRLSSEEFSYFKYNTVPFELEVR